MLTRNSLPEAPQIFEKIFLKSSGIPSFVRRNKIHSTFDIPDTSFFRNGLHTVCSVLTYDSHNDNEMKTEKNRKEKEMKERSKERKEK